jgi:hypothetical protein
LAKRKAKPIKEIRSEYARLKKAGVVPRNVDSRSLKDTPTIRRYLSRFKPILTGEAAAVRVSNKDSLRELREAGYKITKAKGSPARVIVPKNPLDTVSVTKQGKVQRITRENDFAKHVTIPKKSSDLLSYLESLRGQKLPPGEQLAFKFFGNGSHAVFGDYDDAVDYLLGQFNGSGSDIRVLNAISSGRAKDQNEIYQNLEFITFKGTKQNRMKWAASNRARREAIPRKRGSLSGKAKDAHLLRMRKVRASMTEEQRKEYNKKGLARAKKSNKKRRK